MKIRVMFTAVGGWPTPVTIKSFQEASDNEYYVVGTDVTINPATKTYCDKVYQVSRSTSPTYVDELLYICEKERIDVLVPLISEDIDPIFESLDRFEKIGTKVLLSNRNSELEIANDKLKLYEHLTANGINVMPMTIPYNEETLDEDLKTLGYPDVPIAVKLKDGCGGAGFKILDEKMAIEVCKSQSRKSRVNPYINKQQLIEIGANGRYLLQTYLDGMELGVLSLVDNGRTIYALCHDNYDMQYATTTDCELVQNTEAENIVMKINRLLKLDGNIGYDFKRDANGKLWLLEINPRISATVVLACKAGVNIVEMGILHKMGYAVDEGIQPLYGLRLKRMYGTIFTYNGEAI